MLFHHIWNTEPTARLYNSLTSSSAFLPPFSELSTIGCWSHHICTPSPENSLIGSLNKVLKQKTDETKLAFTASKRQLPFPPTLSNPALALPDGQQGSCRTPRCVSHYQEPVASTINTAEKKSTNTEAKPAGRFQGWSNVLICSWTGMAQ